MKDKLKYINFIFLFILLCPALFAKGIVSDSTQTKNILLLEIKADIDPRMSHYIELGLEQAQDPSIDMVLIEMDTYGGLLTDADKIVSQILDFEKPIHVFINKDAASAGALISIGCDSIYMAPGASIGAATVVVGESGQAAPDKYQSYMRGMMRSTAEAKGRNPDIAEAMVDENLDLDSLAPAGKVLTMSTKEAIENNFCEAEVKSIEAILERQNIPNYTLTTFDLGWEDKVIALFLNPFISGILIMIIVGGIYFELQTPGVGFPIIAAIIALTLYLTPYYIHGFAANWEILLFFVGVVLLVVEIFVIPGFGIAGVSGVVLMVGSLILVMLDNVYFDFSNLEAGALTNALLSAVAGILGSALFFIVFGIKFTDSKLFLRLALTTTQNKDKGYSASFNSEELMGKTGTAHTILRPSGKVIIEEEIYDASTRGDYIEKGTKIKVISLEGTSLKVKAI